MATISDNLKRFHHLLYICLMLLVATGCKSGASVKSNKHAKDTAPTTSVDLRKDLQMVHGVRRAIVEEALSWQGTPYRYADATKGEGTDCSGMVLRVYERVAEIKLPRNSAKQEEYCDKVKERDVRPGDLVFFATGSDRGKVSHVGLMIDGQHMIHASSKKGVVISDITTPYYSDRLIGFGKVPGL